VPVGLGMLGTTAGEGVGDDDVGAKLGLAVGCGVVGKEVGAAVGSDVGIAVGASVFHSHECPTVEQLPSEQWWVAAQLHR